MRGAGGLVVEAAQDHRKSSGAEFFCTASYRTATLGRSERYERWRSECETIVDPGELVGSVNGQVVGRRSDTLVERASCANVVPGRQAARSEGIRLCVVVQAVESTTANLLDRAASEDIVARVLHIRAWWCAPATSRRGTNGTIMCPWVCRIP